MRCSMVLRIAEAVVSEPAAMAKNISLANAALVHRGLCLAWASGIVGLERTDLPLREALSYARALVRIWC